MQAQAQQRTPLKPMAYRLKDAAVVMGVGTSTIRKLIDAGKLRAVRIGAAVMITDDDIRAFFATGGDR